MQKLGGRKFILTLLVLGLGTWIALTHPEALTTQLVTLFAILTGSFHVSNYASTATYLSSRKTSVGDPQLGDLYSKVSDVHRTVTNQEDAARFAQTLQTIQSGVGQLSETAGQIAQGMVTINQQVGQVKKHLANPGNFNL